MAWIRAPLLDGHGTCGFVLSPILKPPGDVHWDVIVAALVIGAPLDSLVSIIVVVVESSRDILPDIFLVEVIADSSLSSR